MPIRPIDIRRKEFKNGFRGYDANQVDDFLDAVADEYERNYTENQRMREEISSLRDRLQQFEDLEGSIRAALVHAEQASNDLRRAATSEAEDMRQSAQREADFTIREAQSRSHQMLADSSSRIERVQDSYEALQEAKKSFTNDFRFLLKSYMETMDNMEIASAREIEASLRERLDTESIAVSHEAAEEEARVAREAAAAPTIGDEGDLTDPDLADLEPGRVEPGIAETGLDETEERAFASTETTEDDPDATQLLETETAPDEPPLADEPAAAEVVPEQSEAQEEGPAEDDQTTQVLRPEGYDTLSGDPEPEQASAEEAPAGEPEVVEPEVEPSTAEDTTEVLEPPVTEPEAAEEVEQEEEPALAEEKGSQESFEKEQGDQGDNRIFRASRFLRRRD